MVDFYYRMVIDGKKLWTDIRKLWKDKVCDKLKENGYILNEDGTVSLEKDTKTE